MALHVQGKLVSPVPDRFGERAPARLAPCRRMKCAQLERVDVVVLLACARLVCATCLKGMYDLLESWGSIQVTYEATRLFLGETY